MASSLKELRSRLRSVRSIQKITNAMRMVSASKLKKSQYLVKDIQQFSESFHSYTCEILSQYEHESLECPFLQSLGHENELLIVVTSNRGLCGSFNSMILKKAQDFINQRKNNGEGNLKILAVGEKARNYFLKHYPLELVEIKPEITLSQVPLMDDIRFFVDSIISLISTKKIAEVSVISSRFKNVLKQTPIITKLFPFERDREHNLNNDFLCESVPSKLINEMLYYDLIARITLIFIENIVSEHASRMTAMESSTRNAREMIQKLELMLNQLRQTIITTELMEVISGADVLREN